LKINRKGSKLKVVLMEAVMFEDDPVVKKTVQDFPANLVDISVTDLREYIVALNEEIARVEVEITKKQAASSAADAFFK
tara:strand:+ start:1015 stop:1251 length:237 start_codon:yes stop_codon:yes gene_type:complete